MCLIFIKTYHREKIKRKTLLKKNSTYRGIPTYSSILNVITCLNESFPSCTSSANLLYAFNGDEPVGRPNTKGLSSEG